MYGTLESLHYPTTSRPSSKEKEFLSLLKVNSDSLRAQVEETDVH